jgi:hypothetical protein
MAGAYSGAVSASPTSAVLSLRMVLTPLRGRA